MHDILKSDIFFVVTTVVVALLGIGFSIIALYIIRILRDIKSLSTKVKEEGEGIVDQVRSLRNSFSLPSFLPFSFGSSSWKSKKKSKERGESKEKGRNED